MGLQKREEPQRPRAFGYLDQQLVAIRSAAYGLSEQQARQTPCLPDLPYQRHLEKLGSNCCGAHAM